MNLGEKKDNLYNIVNEYHQSLINNDNEISEWELLSTTTFSSENSFSNRDYEKSSYFENSNTSMILKKEKKSRKVDFEIIPGYGSDTSTEETLNTIGNLSLDKYADFPHIGYDINGKKIMRPATKPALDALLNTMNKKDEWTGIIDKDTGEDIRLTSEEIDIIRKIQHAQIPDDHFNPFEDYVDYFSGKLEKTPLNTFSEPKRRFIPSKNEQKRIMKIVQAIREGRIVPSRLKENIEQQPVFYDIWSDTSAKSYDHIMHIPAPKLPLPTHDESYNPPEEYLLSEDEIKKWNDTSPEDREKNYLPSKYKSLRLVPGYDRFIQECFERCLDLYLAPRVRKNRLNIDPDSLIPKLPSPEDLRPFPTRCSTIYKGHKGRVRSINIDSNGLWLASGGDDGIVCVWEIITGKEMCSFKCSDNEPVDSVAWRPIKNSDLILASCGNNVYIYLPSIHNDDIKNAAKEFSNLGFSIESTQTIKTLATWSKPSSKQADKGLILLLDLKKRVKQVVWHRHGDYFVTVAPENANTSVLVHLLSKHQSQSPFKKTKGIVQAVEFHPTKPLFFVATQRYVKVYNLVKQELIKIIHSGVRWISSIDIHPQGDNIIIGSYDKKLVWVDMDLSSRPYKTLCYHTKALRSVAFHKGIYPLFCSSADDGTIHVFYGMVYNDLMENPLLVPLKILRGHEIKHSLGVLNTQWHPKQPWLFSCGADSTIRLWT